MIYLFFYSKESFDNMYIYVKLHTYKNVCIKGENIADNGGLKAAYHAFLKSEATKDADILKLPGLNLTHKQLFFVSFAQVWCSSTTNETSILQMEKDAHAPSPYRVIGTLSNTFEFADAFNCKANSKMNQNKKCVVW
ncbi:neprilysin-3-like [Rhagoletis pomonella]|uniref:neprilysin-3-like n=1 Tax=Rhagoletis pomonella TaxID=28610 RepID=UPI00177D5C4C|nr:neprilysin-3-like [Rhagoletis pomonella]